MKPRMQLHGEESQMDCCQAVGHPSPFHPTNSFSASSAIFSEGSGEMESGLLSQPDRCAWYVCTYECMYKTAYKSPVGFLFQLLAINFG